MKNNNALRALTVKQPFASPIVWGVKDVENRSQKTSIRGHVLIHAGAQWYEGYRKKGHFFPSNLITCDQRQFLTIEQQTNLLRPETQLPLSAIIGEVDIVDCVQDSQSVWAIDGYWHWVLENAVMYPEPILSIKGKLSFWKPDAAVLNRIYEQRFLTAQKDSYQ